MFLPPVTEDNNTRAMIDTWLGYNHNYRANPGEFWDEENLSSDQFPLFSPRKLRPVLIEQENIRGTILYAGNLCYLAGDKFHYGEQVVDLAGYTLATSTSQQQIIPYGAYILIMPMGVIINTADLTDVQALAASYTVTDGVTITYRMCDMNGSDRNATVSATAPANPTDGQYWVNTTTGEAGLYVYDGAQSSWTPVPTSYIKITIPGAQLTQSFAAGDVVTFNSYNQDLNRGAMIQILDDEYMVVMGMMNDLTHTETTTASWHLNIQRKVPTMDYVCADDNRVWGCYYGYNTAGELVNEIYASKLGDPTNWYVFQALSTDSYTMSCGVPGKFTGCITYQGYPHFFKENAIIKVYGSMPSEYQAYVTSCRGVQDGSYRSLAIVNEYLIYKSPSDIVIYDGSYPTSISQPLGRDRVFYSAVGGGTLNKYYVSMEDAGGKYYYFNFDLQYNVWHKEDAIRVESFTAEENGQIYAATDGKIYGIGANENVLFLNKKVGEEYVKWYAETIDMGVDLPDYKTPRQFTIRAYVPVDSEIVLQISYDGMPYEDIGIMRAPGELVSRVFQFVPYRCDHYRLKLSGHGPVRIYSLTTTYEMDSEEKNEYHI